jgi:hypothetical protein
MLHILVVQFFVVASVVPVSYEAHTDQIVSVGINSAQFGGYYAAYVEAMRADYCGDHSTARDGQLIDICAPAANCPRFAGRPGEGACLTSSDIKHSCCGIPDKEQPMTDNENAVHFKEMSHAGKTIAIRDDATHFELRIDGIPIPMVSRLSPHQYATMVFPQQDFPTAEAMAKALAETEGKLWVLDRKKDTSHEMK